MSGRPIPFYSYDGSYLDHITIRRAERLEEMGRVKVVRHGKGHVNRAVLLRGKDEAHEQEPGYNPRSVRRQRSGAPARHSL